LRKGKKGKRTRKKKEKTPGFTWSREGKGSGRDLRTISVRRREKKPMLKKKEAPGKKGCLSILSVEGEAGEEVETSFLDGRGKSEEKRKKKDAPPLVDCGKGSRGKRRKGVGARCPKPRRWGEGKGVAA